MKDNLRTLGETTEQIPGSLSVLSWDCHTYKLHTASIINNQH